MIDLFAHALALLICLVDNPFMASHLMDTVRVADMVRSHVQTLWHCLFAESVYYYGNSSMIDPINTVRVVDMV